MANKNFAARTKGAKGAQKNQNTWLWIAGALVIALVAVGAIYIGTQRNNPTADALPAEISVDQAYQKYQEGAFVLDVRTPQEWDDYHAPGTTLIPLDELPARVDELPKDQDIVIVCRSGNRSQNGRNILLDAGFEQVTSMSGGLNAWGAAGYPLESQIP